MASDSRLSSDILKDLEKIYLMALGKENFSVALKAKELLGRQLGFFALKNPMLKKNKLSLEHLSDEDITHLIKELEAKLKLDPGEREE